MSPSQLPVWSARRCVPAFLLPLALAACAGPAEEPAPESELTPAQLEDLLQQGAIEPAGPDGEDPFDGVVPGMEDDPFARFLADEEMAGDAFADFRADGGTEAEAAPPGPSDPLALFAENPYLTFGRRIKIYPDGSITKPFPLRPGTGEKMLQLIQSYGNFPVWTAEMGSGPSPPTMVKLDLLVDWDVELVQDMRDVTAKATPNPVADWLVVTTGEDLLWEVEEFINLFAAGVPQIEIEAKIVEITFTESLSTGVSPIDADTPIFDWGSKTFIESLNYGFPAADGAAMLGLGAVQNGFQFNAILEALATNDNVSIISRPKVAVREGGRAHLVSSEKIPYLEITTLNNTGGFNTKLNYLEIGVQLYVVPRVVGTDTVALDIDIEASQQTGDQIVAAIAGIGSSADQVTVPILATRSARTVVYLRPGQAVILGGLINERNVEQIRKVPVLGDIPIVKWLFRSRFTSKEQRNVLFFIRPRILQGADLAREF